MIRLRTLGEAALVAGFIAGLAGCASRTGDLGAEPGLTPVVKSEPAAVEQARAEVAANKSAGEVVDVSEQTNSASAENVAMARLADLAAASEASTGRKIAGGTLETKDEEAKPEPAETPKPAAPEAEAPKVQEPPTPAPAPVPVPVPAPVPAPVPVPVPAPAPQAPAAETAEERAARLLKESERLASVETQANLREADAAYQAGLKAFNDLEYEQAQKLFERAVKLDAANEPARQKLRVVNALLGIHAERLGRQIAELEAAERVKVQERIVVLGQALEASRALEERGSREELEAAPEDKERVLQDQLDALKRAQDGYRRVKEIMNWMPPSFELPSGRAQVEASLARVRVKIAEKQDAIAFLRRLQADESVKAERQRETEKFHIRIQKMLDEVQALFDRRDYKGAERLAVAVLKQDPFNASAESWKNRARSAYHALERDKTQESLRYQTQQTWDDVAAAGIGDGVLLRYPPNWDEISKRSEASVGKKASLEPWKQDIRKKLQRKVTFEFLDTPLDDAIKFLRDLANVTIIVDPKVMAGGPPPVTLRVQDMSLDVALDWILKMEDLSYALQDNAIFISRQAALQDPNELRIYDVSDLTSSIPDFPGPEMQLSIPGDPSVGGGGGGIPALGGGGGAPSATVETLASIADRIRTRVRPESWDPALGTVIEEKAGRLVVMQKPEIHALIDQMLASYRSTQRMMVNIESRFLEIRESYLEEIGVEFQGLDPNILFGDFGDIRHLGGVSGYTQPRTTAGTERTNLPWPGFVNGIDRILGGSFSEVGAIVMHQVPFFPGDPDTISARDGASGKVIQGGLSAQLTIINNAQVQAFIRALGVRENASTLTAPRLTVFNTQRAHMFVARQRSYVGDYNVSGDSFDPIIRQFLTGVVLDVRPIVSADRRYVTLEMRPTVTDLINFNTRQIDFFTINTTAGGGGVIIQLSFPIQFPELSIRRVRTTATVPDGGIMLLSGLYRNIKFNAENGVPFLSDLPVVGRLFRWNTVDNAKSNLAILVSPKIMLFSEEEDKL